MDWNTATVEKALAAGTDEWTIYSATKKVSEREVWNVAEEHPDIDITTSMHIFCVETRAFCLITGDSKSAFLVWASSAEHPSCKQESSQRIFFFEFILQERLAGT